MRASRPLRTSRTAYWSIDVAADREHEPADFFALTGIEREDWDASATRGIRARIPDDYPVMRRAYEDCPPATSSSTSASIGCALREAGSGCTIAAVSWSATRQAGR